MTILNPAVLIIRMLFWEGSALGRLWLRLLIACKGLESGQPLAQEGKIALFFVGVQTKDLTWRPRLLRTGFKPVMTTEF